jgi:hypothetical protein
MVSPIVAPSLAAQIPDTNSGAGTDVASPGAGSWSSIAAPIAKRIKHFPFIMDPHFQNPHIPHTLFASSRASFHWRRSGEFALQAIKQKPTWSDT